MAEPQVMAREAPQVCPSIDSKSQPHYSNGCCVQCCGDGPPAITEDKIKKFGNGHVKWIQKPDGRVIEYYVYGSESSDARIFVQIHGSISSAKLFSEIPKAVQHLKDHNMKGIAVNLPGHGFTSPDPFRRLGAWPSTDLAPVLAAEGVPEDAPLYVEGTSFGSGHAFSVLNHYQDRIAGLHFIVPAVSIEAAKDNSLTPVSEGCPCDATYGAGNFLVPGRWCSPCLFCCCSCLAPTIPAQAGALKGLPGWDLITDYDAIHAMKEHNMKHAMANSIAGPFIYSVMLKRNQRMWGFDPFGVPSEKVAKMKVMVSYGEGDKATPEDNGAFMGEYFSKHCNKDGRKFANVSAEAIEGNDMGGRCLVNHKKGGRGGEGTQAGDGRGAEAAGGGDRRGKEAMGGGAVGG